MKSKYDICIIGAGAAGLSAAGMIKKKSVVVLDKNKKPGTKLYATGNGRCNLANAVISYSDYYGNMFPFEVFNESEKLFKELNLLINTSPLSTATPKRTINPTPAEILNGIPRSDSEKIPPMVASGTAIYIINACLTDFNAK